MSDRSISRNASLNLVGQLVTAAVAFACVPFTVRVLGIERFGLLSLLWVLIGYVSLLDLGLGPAVTRAVADALGKQDTRRVFAVFWTANRLQLALAIAGGSCLAALAPVLVEHVLGVPAALRREATLSLYLSAIALPGVLVSSSLVGLLQAARRFDLTNAAQVPLGVAQFILPLLCGWWWPNLAFVVGALLVSRLAGVAVLLVFATRTFPGLWAGPHYDRLESRALFRFGGCVTVSGIVSSVMVYADRFLLGSLRSLSAVSFYTVPSDAATRLLVIPRSLVPAVFPVFSGSARAEERSELAARTLKFILLFVGVPVIPLVACAPDLMTLWMGPEFARHSALVLQLLLVGVVFNALAYVPLSLTQAAGRADATGAVHVSELALYGGLAYAGIRTWGAAGAAAAWSLRTAADLAAMLVVSRLLAGFSFRHLGRQRVPLLLLVLVVCGAAALAAETVLPRTPLRLLAGFGFGVVSAALSWRLCLTADDRIRIIRLVTLRLGGDAVPEPGAKERVAG